MENKLQGEGAEQKEGGREGYQPTGNYQRDYRTGGKSPRPRIHTQRTYTNVRSSNDEGGFRPEGFGAGLQSASGQQRPYRPRFNSQEGGYQPRPQGYRPRYNNQEAYGQEGGYQPRQQSYRPRYNNQEGEQGGYQN